MRVLAFGGGTDTTGLLGGWVEHDMPPIDLILMADTGDERPHTYRHIDLVSEWLVKHGMPPITMVRRVRRDQSVLTLSGYCLESKSLPSLAYGFKSCSQKFKVQPQEKYLNNLPAARAAWKRGEQIEKLIGYEFNETRRWAKAALVVDKKYTYRFPLVEWEWTRSDCVDAIKRMGLPLPGKSACFMCPASTKPEIGQLKKEYPVLFARALEIEANAELKTVKGLGRRFSWRDYATTAEESEVMPCMVCVDGS